MLKNKIITHSLCTLFFATAPLAVAVTPGNAWDVKTIDYETHHTSTNPVEGVYLDKGAWKWRAWPYSSINGGYRFLTVEIDPLRHGIAFWLVQIPKSGWYKLETSYFSTENRTYDADYAVYVNNTTAEAEALTAKPVYKVSINQTQVTGSSTPWRNLGTYCLKEKDISMIVLDGRDDSQSDSTDASRWTYMGEVYNSQGCNLEVNMAPINHLLLKPRT